MGETEVERLIHIYIYRKGGLYQRKLIPGMKIQSHRNVNTKIVEYKRCV